MNLEEFSRYAAKNYLHSAVFIDDHIFDQRPEVPVSITLPPERKPIFHKAPKDQVEVISSSQESAESPYHPKELVASFAREGIVCALYEPPHEFTTDANSEVFKLCESPDIIILDWDFSRDQGEKALSLITTLAKQSAETHPHHVRLISIYTSDQSLVAVANKIADRLQAENLHLAPEDSQYRLRTGATRLVVMGKPIQRFGLDEIKFTVREEDLANRLIEEFASMNSGILPSYALHGLAGIRKNSKRILDKFTKNLDGAFILHRKLISESEEAFNQLPELLSEEFRAVLDDHMLSEQRTASISASALSNDNITQIDKDIADSLPNGNIPTRAARNAAKKIREGDTISEHQKFAALFCSRTQYTKTLRVLTFGTIVRFKNPNDDNWQFAICLIPSCDSLRLDPEQPAHFPFWTLQKDDYPESGGGKRSGMILLSRAGEPIALSASPSKAGQRIWTTSLSVSQQNRRVVASSVEDNFVFQCFDGRSIEWVGQLKTLHAHRIANTIMHDLCRVGLSEAEWLRLTCSST